MQPEPGTLDRSDAVQAESPDYAEWLTLAAGSYTSSVNFMNAYLRPEWEKAIRQWQGKHGADSKYMSDAYRGRSKLFRPKTRASVRKNEASAAVAFFSTQDAVNIEPIDDNDELQSLSAEILSGVINYRLENSIPWFLTVIGAYQETQKTGICLSYQYWEYGNGKDRPVIELLPPENVHIDPGADWKDPITSSPYVIREIPLYIVDVQERMNTPDPKTGQPKWFYVDEKTLLTTSGVKFNASTRIIREGRADTKTLQTSGYDPYTICWVRENFVRKDGQEWVYFTLGDTHMLTAPKPLREVYFHGVRPFVMGWCNLEVFKAYPSGTVAMSKDIQDELNEVTNQRTDNVKFALNKRYFVKRGKNVDIRSITRNVPGSVTLMDDPSEGGDVRIVSTPDITSSAFQEQDRLNLDFDDLTGAFSQATVQANRALNETVGGMTLMSDGANQVSEYQLRLFSETWVQPVLKQLVLLEQKYETDLTILKFAAGKSELFKQYTDLAITDELIQGTVNVRVNVGIGSTNPEVQVKRFIEGMNALAGIIGPDFIQRLDVEEVTKELFGKLGYKDGARFFKPVEGNPQIAQLQQQIQQLQQQLAQKRSPEVDAATAKKINADAVKVGAEAAYAAIQTAQAIAAMPQIAPVADSIMQSAGYQRVPGDDPNYPAPTLPNVNPPAVRQNTSPQLPPVPASSLQGIETQRFDA